MAEFLACYQGIGIELSDPRMYGSMTELLMDMRGNTYQPDLVINEDIGKVVFVNAKFHYPMPIPGREHGWAVVIMQTLVQAYWATTEIEARQYADRANGKAITNLLNTRYIPIPCKFTPLFDMCPACDYSIDLSKREWAGGWSWNGHLSLIHTQCLKESTW